MAGAYDEADAAPGDGARLVMASFNVEDFGTERMQRVTAGDLDERYDDFKRLMQFEDIVPSGSWRLRPQPALSP